MSWLTRILGISAVTVAWASPLPAQSLAAPSGVRRAVETITETDFQARIGVLAHDSMRGRDTPSRELEAAARWIASQFRSIGLEPAGDGGSYLQNVTMSRRRPDSTSAVMVTVRRAATKLLFGREIAYLGGPLPQSRSAFPVVLMVGTPPDLTHPFADVAARGTAVIMVAPADQLRNDVFGQLLAAGREEGVAAWIVVSDVPENLWARLASGSLAGELWELAGRPRAHGEGLPLFLVQRPSLGTFLSDAGMASGGPDSTTGFEVRQLADAEVVLEPVWRVSPTVQAPNVVGVLRGSDPTLRDEAVVFVAHMDHVGVTADGRCAAVGADSICNGANDNASGVAGVIELAEAYAALRPRPRRTLVFLAVTAEERGLLGAYHYTDNPTVPLERTVATINFDMLTRNAPDSIQLVGKEYSSLGAVADRIAAEHPELRVVPMVDRAQQAFAFQSSDHYPFAVKGVPTLFFFSGMHQDLHGPTDSPERADCDKAARVARVAFYVGLDVANADGRPTWDPEARARVVEGEGGR